MDADDEDGVCKGLPEPPRVPLVEFVVVPRWPDRPVPETQLKERTDD